MTGIRYKSLFLWAFIVCYAQLYVGAHYPTDVIGGALLGILVGYLTAKLFTPKAEILKSNLEN